MVQQHLKSFPAVTFASHRDSCVSGPVGFGLEGELEVPIGVVADEISSVSATRMLLLTDDRTVFDLPACGVFLGMYRGFNSARLQHVVQVWTTGIHSSVGSPNCMPSSQSFAAGEGDSLIAPG